MRLDESLRTLTELSVPPPPAHRASQSVPNASFTPAGQTPHSTPVTLRPARTPPASTAAPPDTLVLLIDRREDPLTPLLQPWTYLAMAHDTFGISRSNVVRLSTAGAGSGGGRGAEGKGGKEGGARPAGEQPVNLLQDPYFEEMRWLNISDAAERSAELVRQLNEINALKKDTTPAGKERLCLNDTVISLSILSYSSMLYSIYLSISLSTVRSHSQDDGAECASACLCTDPSDDALHHPPSTRC